jgi:hypothetical protein
MGVVDRTDEFGRPAPSALSVTPVQQPPTVKELAMTVISTTTAAAGAR